MVKAIKACFIVVGLMIGSGIVQAQSTGFTDRSYLIITCAENGTGNVLVTAESQGVSLVLVSAGVGTVLPLEVGKTVL